MEIEPAVRITKRRRAQCALFPLHLARGELHAGQGLRGGAIEKIPDLHRAADSRGKLRLEIHLLRLNVPTFDVQFDQTAAGARGRAVNVTVAGDRRGNIRAITADRLSETPQKLARLRLHADQTFLKELNVLLDATRLDDDGGSKGGIVTFWQGAFPDHFAVFLVQSHQSGLAAAGRANERLAINQR